MTGTSDRNRFKFSWNVRVGFSDTDAQGIVYYGRYLPYFDRARVEYLRDRGMLGMDIGEEGHEFVMRALAVEYHAPAVFDDLIGSLSRIQMSNQDISGVRTSDVSLFDQANDASEPLARRVPNEAVVPLGARPGPSTVHRSHNVRRRDIHRMFDAPHLGEI